MPPPLRTPSVRCFYEGCHAGASLVTRRASIVAAADRPRRRASRSRASPLFRVLLRAPARATSRICRARSERARLLCDAPLSKRETLAPRLRRAPRNGEFTGRGGPDDESSLIKFALFVFLSPGVLIWPLAIFTRARDARGKRRGVAFISREKGHPVAVQWKTGHLSSPGRQ